MGGWQSRARSAGAPREVRSDFENAKRDGGFLIAELYYIVVIRRRVIRGRDESVVRSEISEPPELHALACFVHGALTALHVLGAVYNYRRRNW